MNTSNKKQLSTPKKVGYGILICGGLLFIVSRLAPDVLDKITPTFPTSAVANSNSELPSEKATEVLAAKGVVAKNDAQVIVSDAKNGVVYEDTIVPPPPAYQTSLEFDKIMSTYNLVTRVNKKAQENAYVYAGLKLDQANRREIIAIKQLQASELAVDETIAKHNSQIAKYNAGIGESTDKKNTFVGASSGDASSENLSNMLLGSSSQSSEMTPTIVQTDSIRLASIANNKAMLYINGKPYEGVRTGDTVNLRYEVLNINSNRRCITLSDLKTEERDELAPVCIH